MWFSMLCSKHSFKNRRFQIQTDPRAKKPRIWIQSGPPTQETRCLKFGARLDIKRNFGLFSEGCKVKAWQQKCCGRGLNSSSARGASGVTVPAFQTATDQTAFRNLPVLTCLWPLSAQTDSCESDAFALTETAFLLYFGAQLLTHKHGFPGFTSIFTPCLSSRCSGASPRSCAHVLRGCFCWCCRWPPSLSCPSEPNLLQQKN